MTNQRQKIPNAITIAIPIPPNTGTLGKAMFPDVPQIRNRKILAIVTYDDQRVDLDLSGNPIIRPIDTRATFVNLSDNKSNFFVSNVPYNFFNTTVNQQRTRYFKPGRILAINKCYFQFTGLAAQGLTILLTFIYE